MSFATTKLAQATTRTMLVRFTPARCVDSNLTAIGGGVYQMTWTRPVANLARNGAALTLVTTLSGNDQYTFSEATGILQVQLAAAPDDTANVMILFYYLFFSSGMALTANQNPTDATTPMRQWEPRITKEPQLRQTMQNIMYGVLTISDASVTLVNVDAFFNQFLSPTDSFKQKDVDIWFAIRSSDANTPDYVYAMKGQTNQVVVTEVDATFSLYEAYSGLANPAFMGDNANECYLLRTAASYPNADPQKAGRTVPYHVGKWSRYQTKNFPGFYGCLTLDPAYLPEASCTSYNANCGTTVNRTWVLGRCSPDGLRSWSLPMPDGGVPSNLARTSIFSWQQSTFLPLDVQIGDNVKLSQSGVGTFYGRVIRIDLQVGAGPFTSDIYVYYDNTGGTAAFTNAGVSITCYSDPALVLVDTTNSNTEYPLAAGRDFTTSISTTSGGNDLVSIALVSNFEGNLTALRGYPVDFTAPLDSNKHKIYFRLRLATTNYTKHGDVLKRLITVSGLTPNAATFATANSTLAINAAFSIPYFDEGDYRTHLDYAQDLLASTLGLLVIDSTAQVQYILLALPSSTDSNDDNVILRGSYSVTIVYDDIITGIVTYNPHNSDQAALDATPTPVETRSSAKAQYLHGISRTYNFRHLLETITGRIDEIFDAMSNRAATYTFDVSSKYLDSKLGDDLVLANGFLLGSDTSRAVKIMGLDRSGDRVTVDALDLQGMF